MDSFTVGGWYTLVFLLALVLAVCWIVLPFAVIGTKPLLRQLIQEQRRTNELLMQAASRAAANADSRHPAEPRHMSAVRDYPTESERATEKARGTSAFVIALAVMAGVGLLVWWFFMRR
jgi:hypothetical protein